MNDAELTAIIRETKKYVLSAIEKNLPPRFAFAIDDVVQETYLRAYKALTKGSFRYDAKISTWLYTIARNESLRMAEKLGRDESRTSSLDALMTEPGRDDGTLDLEIESLQSAINTLPEKYRYVMDLMAQGYSEREIALKLAIPPGTVKSRSSRGRELIRQTLEGGSK